MPRSRPLPGAVPFVLLATSVLVIWAGSSAVGDLFMSLSGGRDVMQGRLGSADDWSFMTGGRVWVNQNWLSHVLIYMAWLTGRETGLLMLKALLLVAMSGFTAMVAQRRGASWPTAAVIAAALTLACFRFVTLRPNLITLMLVPLAMLLLYRTENHRGRIGWVIPLVALWSNAHGGFVFALGMIGLWMLCMALDAWRRSGAAGLREAWPFAAALVACVAACAISPFGLHNLTHPLVIASSVAWRQVPEWLPLLSPNVLPFPWEFTPVMGVAALLGVVAWLSAAGRPAKPKSAVVTSPSIGPVVFEWLLLAVATAMAFQSRRFVPLAVLIAAAPIAASFAATPERVRRALTAVAFGGLSIACVVIGWQNFQSYRSDNPMRRGGTVFDRMHSVSDYFPVAAGEFLAANQIAGNALAEWEWEGYLRWVDPRVRVFMGGRAQQIYHDDVMTLWSRIQNTGDGPQLLADNNIHLLIVNQSPRFFPLLARLRAGRQWATLFDDGRVLVMADAHSASTSALVLRALAGQLTYPSVEARELSHAMGMLTGEAAPDTAMIIAALERANEAAPIAHAYELAAGLASSPRYRDSVTGYLEREAPRLEALQPKGRGEQQVRLCRLAIQQALGPIYRAEGKTAAARDADDRANELAEAAGAAKLMWR